MTGSPSAGGVLAALSSLLTTGLVPGRWLATGDTTKTAVFFSGAGFLVVLILIGVAAIILALFLLRRSRR